MSENKDFSLSISSLPTHTFRVDAPEPDGLVVARRCQQLEVRRVPGHRVYRVGVALKTQIVSTGLQALIRMR